MDRFLKQQARADSRSAGRRFAFTLVEVMIVIAIIAILASITLGVVNIAKKAANEAQAKSTVQAMAQALENYYLDEGRYPAFGKKPDPEANYFPLLYNALQDNPKSEGGLGGRNAPYLDNIEEDSIYVVDDSGEGYVPSTQSERRNNKIDKYVVDPWENPYVYRCNKGIVPLKPYMKNRKYDIYSWGPNGTDDTILELEGEENDDIGNW